jgi:hypothetical protein
MNEVLLKLRENLNSMIEIIDKYIPSQDDVIIIKKEDMKYLNFLGKSYDRNIFEYSNSIRFVLEVKSYLPYEKSFYDRIMNGTIERIILNKLNKEILIDGVLINYKLEEWEKTKLRDNYNKNQFNITI